MRNKGKKCLAFLLSLAMFTGMIPANVFAGEKAAELPEEYMGSVSELTGEGGMEYILDTDGVDQDEAYLIVAEKKCNAMYREGASIHSRPVKISEDGQSAVIDDKAVNVLWSFDGTGKILNGEYKLVVHTNSNRPMLKAHKKHSTIWSAEQKEEFSGQYVIGYYLLDGAHCAYPAGYLDFDDISSDESYVRLYKQTQTPGDSTFTVGLSGIEKLLGEVENPRLHLDSFLGDLQDAYNSARLAANEAVKGTDSDYATEAEAQDRQEFVNAAALALYNAYQALMEASVVVTVEYVDEAGDAIADMEEHIYADGAAYSFNAPQIRNYVMPDPAIQTGMAAKDTKVIFVYGADLSRVADKAVEFWITNSKVSDKEGNVRITLSASEASGAEGVEVADRVPSAGVSASTGNEVIFWKTVVLPYSDRQTTNSGDKTAAGTEFRFLRYFGDQWEYSTDGDSWSRILDDDQLVAYYLENTELTNEVQVSMKDWGFKGSDTWDSYGDGYCAVAYQVVYEDGTTAPADLRSSAMVYFFYRPERTLGTVIVSENGDYDIWKVTSSSGWFNYSSRRLSSTHFYWNDDETEQWTGDMDGSLLMDSTKSPYQDLKWQSHSSAILIRIYVRAKQTTDSLTVNYRTKNGDGFYNYNIVVNSGTTFGALGNGPDNDGYYQLPEEYSVINELGVTQTINTDLSSMPEISEEYGNYTFLGATLDDDDKTLNLYYELDSWNVSYSWTNAPAGVTLPAGETVTNGSNYQVDTVYTASTVINHMDEHQNVDGKWTFSGWSPAGTITVTGNTEITGTWTYTAYITVTAGSTSKTYDGAALTDGTFHVTSGMLAEGDYIEADVSGSITNTGSIENSISSIKVYHGEGTAKVDVSNNYLITPVSGTLTINAKAVTIKVNDASKTYGASDPAFIGTVSGLVAGNDLGAVTYVRTNADVNAAGNYTDVLNAVYTPNGNYTVTVDRGDFEIKTAESTAKLTASGGVWTYDGTAHTVAAGIDGGTDYTIYYKVGDGEWSTTAPSVTNVSDGTVTVSVKAEKTGYTPLIVDDVTLTINAKAATIKVNDASKTYGATDPAFTGTVNGLVAENDLGTVTYVRTNADVNAAGNYTDVLNAVYTPNGNYTVTVDRGDFRINESSSGGGQVIPDNPTPTDPKPELNKTDHFAYIVGRGNGGVQPEAQITRAEVATIFFRMLTDQSRAQYWSQTNSFTDVDSAKWYNNAVSTLTNAGVLQGYPDGTFRPDAPITRAEFAKMAVRFYDAAGEYEADAFTDIGGHWASNYINRAAELGLVNGYEDGTFRPNNRISRAESVTIMNSVLERTPNASHLLPEMTTWTDNMDTLKWYYLAMQEATNSHDYEMSDDGIYEIWKKIQPARDWTALEKEWSNVNTSAAAD